jgi:hypothetical protein
LFIVAALAPRTSAGQGGPAPALFAAALPDEDAIALTADGELRPAFSPLQVDSYSAGAALAFPLRSGRAFISYRRSASPLRLSSTEIPLASGDSGSSSAAVYTMMRAPISELSVGATRRFGPISLALSAGAAHGIVREDRTTPGGIVAVSVWTDTIGWVPSSHEVSGSRVTSGIGSHWFTGELAAGWTHARFAAGASVGGWFGRSRAPAAGFGSVELSARLLPNVWMVGAAGSAPAFARSAGTSGRYSRLGLRFAFAARQGLTTNGGAADGDAARGAATGSLVVAPIDSASYLFSLRAPDAQRVEISGEFTRWQPVALARTAGGVWVVRLHVAPGAYRANIRIDGGRWLAPPGTAPVADDFGGTAGVVVVPRR